MAEAGASAVEAGAPDELADKSVGRAAGAVADRAAAAAGVECAESAAAAAAVVAAAGGGHWAMKLSSVSRNCRQQR